MQNKSSAISSNIKTLELIAIRLGEICKEVVFVGGCTTGLLITDKAVPDVRYTIDVDCIVDVISLSQYHQLEKKLTSRGFKKSLMEDVICRWFYDELILDIMPTDEKILGFGNQWYKEAITASAIHHLTGNMTIRIITAPYFLATKFEAFKTRGKMDFYASHDFEDIISILDGRTEIVDEILASDEKLKNYLIMILSEISDNRAFHGAIPGHFVQYGGLADSRIEILEQKLKDIIKEHK
ncbi:MAG: hypothetical protein KIT27_05095 [Legionellales bacterium]|nr:hypothetical protein [Legionellales bacterium]